MSPKRTAIPVRSMTGFARVSFGGNGCEVDLEARSVNHRFLDVVVKGPRRYNACERDIKAIFQKLHRRGRIELSITRRVLEPEVGSGDALPQSLDRYVQMYGAACRRYGVSQDSLGSYIGQVLLRAGDEVEDVEISEAEIAALLKGVEECSEALAVMRETEGAALVLDLTSRVSTLATYGKEIAQLADGSPARLRERLMERLKGLAPEITIDSERLAVEVAFLADRIDVAEELSRLGIHLERLTQTMRGEPEGVGRKLDFLVQEVGREINTIGSKAQDANVQGLVVEAKAELERIREQVQNVE
jgi:uncharacterized protein (TIGR00255 family)